MKGDTNMSLLNGMDKIFENKDAEEIAARDTLFEEELAMESDESIDCLVDGVREDYPELYDDDDYEEAIEAAALTGQNFLNSLHLSQGDSIEDARKMAGSLGPNTSAANFSTNFHDEYEDDNDPLHPIPGSVGPDSSTARDPSMEGTIALGFLMNDDTEDFNEYIAQEGLKEWNKNRKEKKRTLDEQLIGVPSLDGSKLDQLCNDGMWNKAEQTVNSAIKAVEAKRKALAYGDKDSKKKDAAAKRLLKTYKGMLVHLSIGKNSSDLEKQGYDAKTARHAARAKANELKNAFRKAEKLDPSTEAAIDLAIQYDVAVEQFEYGAGSVGQKDSAANFSGNFATGTDDQSATYGTKVPGASSAATFEGNQSGGYRNNADPINADDSTVGQDDSTARDPATESYADILADLSALEAEL